MNKDKNNLLNDESANATLFLKRVAKIFLVSVVCVLSINLASFYYMLKPENFYLAQLIQGWGRTYKPILHDQVKPDYLFLGASWVRDTFDTKQLKTDFGVESFNFGVSGGRPYESRRFLQSALAKNTPKTIFINLDSFEEGSRQTKTEFGFDDRLLNNDESGLDNPTTSLWRAYMVALGGAAIGHNFTFMSYLWKINNGALPVDVIKSYDRYDFKKHKTKIQRQDYLLKSDKVSNKNNEQADRHADLGLLRAAKQLEIAITQACAAGVNVKTYFNADSIFEIGCNNNTEREMRFYKQLSEIAKKCPSSISMHTFSYPNIITLEGLLSENDESYFYRRDGHPRPTMGRMIFSRLENRSFPDNTLQDNDDFGIELLSLSAEKAKQAITHKKARCDGQWDTNEWEKLQTSAQALYLKIK